MWAFEPPCETCLLIFGDSRSTSNNSWTTTLSANLGNWSRDNRAVSGSTAAYWAANIGAEMQAQKDVRSATRVLVNVGVNDLLVLPAEATWKADMTTFLDAVHARIPNSPIYLMYPWRRTRDANAATLKGWIDDLIALDPIYLNAGPDEAVWLKGGDDGATNTTDGLHYSAAGQTAAVTAWEAILP